MFYGTDGRRNKGRHCGTNLTVYMCRDEEYIEGIKVSTLEEYVQYMEVTLGACSEGGVHRRMNCCVGIFCVVCKGGGVE